MTVDSIYSFNWIDILMTAILIRAIYIGLKRGIVVELFKLTGALFAVFIALHYFSEISRFLQQKVHLPQAAADLFSFGVLWGVVILAFKFIRDGFGMLFKMEAAHSALDKGGGLGVCIIRALLLCSLTVLFLRASAVVYFTKNLKQSVTATRVAPLAPDLYEATYNHFISKFFPTEELNKDAFRLKDFKTETKQNAKNTSTQK